MTHLNDIKTDTNVSTRSKGSHLTIDDRVKISVLKELEYSNRMIAQYIGVAHGTIDREIKRGRSSPKCWCKLNSANLSFHKLKHTGFF